MPTTKKAVPQNNDGAEDKAVTSASSGMTTEDMLAMIANLTAQINKLTAQSNGEVASSIIGVS